MAKYKYVTQKEYDDCVAKMMERRALIEQSHQPGLTLAQKLELQQKAKAIDPMNKDRNTQRKEHIMTKEIAERLARLESHYTARCIRGQWVVWNVRSDHVVEFADNIIAAARKQSYSSHVHWVAAKLAYDAARTRRSRGGA